MVTPVITNGPRLDTPMAFAGELNTSVLLNVPDIVILKINNLRDDWRKNTEQMYSIIGLGFVIPPAPPRPSQ